MNHLKDQDEVIAFTQELVRRYSPPGQEAGAAMLVHQVLVESGYENVHTDRLGNRIRPAPHKPAGTSSPTHTAASCATRANRG